MKLLVTGGAGYIGSVVSRQLLAAGHEVVVFDSLERGHRAAVAPDARFVQGDLRDAGATAGVVSEGFDGVLHFAALALVGESVSQPELYYHANVVGTMHLLDAMRETGVPRLVFSSTCAVYGQPDEVPIAETAPPRPANAYGASKLAVDMMIGDYCRAHGLGAVSLRYFNVAGAGGEAGEDHYPETHLIPNVMRAALGVLPAVELYGTDYPTPDGTAVRDYIHVTDLAEAHLRALAVLDGGAAQLRLNLGTGRGSSVREVIRAVERASGRAVPVREVGRRAGDPPVLVADARRAGEVLAWKPRYAELDAIVGHAVRWHNRAP